jgi:hypothetical protein
LNVFNIHDVVTALHGIRPVASDAHADDLGNPGPAHIAGGGATEIMKFEIGYFRCLAGLFPRLAEILDRLTIIVEHLPAFV